MRPIICSFCAAAALLSVCEVKTAQPLPTAVASAPAAPVIDQDALCQTDSYQVASHCKEGGKVGFFPRSFGNEQLPGMFAALNCDLRYQVVATNGAVVCIFKGVQPTSPQAPASAASK